MKFSTAVCLVAVIFAVVAWNVLPSGHVVSARDRGQVGMSAAAFAMAFAAYLRAAGQ